jgi:hypothetical protein
MCISGLKTRTPHKRPKHVVRQPSREPKRAPLKDMVRIVKIAVHEPITGIHERDAVIAA